MSLRQKREAKIRSAGETVPETARFFCARGKIYG